MDFGQRFRHYRKLAGLSQKEAASLIGVKYHQLGNYETNRSEPNIETLKNMSRVYKVSVDDLIGNRGFRMFDPKTLKKEEPIDLDELAKNLQEMAERIYNNRDKKK